MNKKIIIPIIFIIILSSLSFASVNLTDGLIHLWRMENTSYIDSISGLNITDTSGDSIGVGKIDNAVYLSVDTSSYMEVGNSILNPVTDDFTINFWFNNSDTANTRFLFSNGDNTNGFYILFVTPKTIRVRFGGTNYDTVLSSFTQAQYYMLSMIYDHTSRNFLVYLNDTLIANNTESTRVAPNDNFRIGNNYAGGLGFYGQIDEFKIYDKVVNFSVINAIYNNYSSITYPGDYYPTPAPVGNDSIETHIEIPTNNHIYNTLNLTVRFNVTLGGNVSSVNCALLRNASLIQAIYNITSGTYELNDTSFNSTTEENYTYYVQCQGGSPLIINNSEILSILIDNVDPIISTIYYDKKPSPITYSTNNRLFLYANECGKWSVTPSHFNCFGTFNHTIKVTATDVNLYSILINTSWGYDYLATNVNYTSFTRYIPLNLSNFTFGTHSIYFQACDGHTKKYIDDAKIEKTINKIKFDNTEIKSLSKSIKSNYKKMQNKYSFSFEYEKPQKRIYIQVPSDCEYIKNSEYRGHFVCYNDKKWIDFEGDYEEIGVIGNTVIVEAKNEQKIFEFNSIGELNCVNYTYYWHKPSITFTYPSSILEGLPSTYTMNFTYNRSFGNITTVTKLYINASTIIPTTYQEINFSGLTSNFYTAVYSFPLLDVDKSYYLNWRSCINNIGNTCKNIGSFPSYYWPIGYVSNQTITVQNTKVGICNATINYSILNIRYYDSDTKDKISLNNGYDISFSDGVQYFNFTGNTTGFNVSFCTNVNPVAQQLNFTLTGKFTLIKNDYITNIYEIFPILNINPSNNPPENLNLYMTKVNGSTTVTYNWFTTEFQLVDGTMFIYRCEQNGSLPLISSVPIVSGIASSNIELLNQPYAYEVVINGKKYTQDSFSVCHTESKTDITYYVDLGIIDYLPVVGLFMVDCLISKDGQNVTLAWSKNLEDTSNIEACIVIYRESIYNNTEIYRNCSNSSSGSFSVIIANNSYTYYAKGLVSQNGYTGYCKPGILTFNLNKDNAKLFGPSALFGIVILLVAVALMFASDSLTSLIAVVISFISVFIIGILVLPWPVVSAVVIFSLIIGIIGRYMRKS